MIREIPVVVLNWNGWDNTAQCLQSLYQASGVKAVWLVDNASEQNQSLEMTAIYPGLRTFRWKENYGYAGGYNRALRIAAAEGVKWAYLLNNDCVVKPGFLEAAVAAGEADDRFAVVGSRIAFANPAGTVEFDGQPHAPGLVPLEPDSRVKIVRYVNGAGILVRLAAMEADGYFDERLFCYWEEHELCLRMEARGWLCCLAAASVVVHKGQGSDSNWNRQYYMVRNRFLVLSRWPETWKEQRMPSFYKAAVLGIHAYGTGQWGQWVAVANGLYDGLRQRSGIRPPTPSKLLPSLCLLSCIAWARLHDKWRRVRGLSAGFRTPDME